MLYPDVWHDLRRRHRGRSQSQGIRVSDAGLQEDESRPEGAAGVAGFGTGGTEIAGGREVGLTESDWVVICCPLRIGLAIKAGTAAPKMTHRTDQQL